MLFKELGKLFSLLLTMFLAHSLDLILVLKCSEYLILPVFFFFAAEHQPAADHILERFKIFGSMVQSVCDLSAVQSAVC